ncbi:hypothetical protein [Bacillus sp. Brlt_9]|uniref:hypothetical protein n=1 Tax=Bacillus sp. Brlt_9 TaxID=3110916 RepID=UPI003F7C5427
MFKKMFRGATVAAIAASIFTGGSSAYAVTGQDISITKPSGSNYVSTKDRPAGQQYINGAGVNGIVSGEFVSGSGEAYVTVCKVKTGPFGAADECKLAIEFKSHNRGEIYLEKNALYYIKVSTDYADNSNKAVVKGYLRNYK